MPCYRIRDEWRTKPSGRRLAGKVGCWCGNTKLRVVGRPAGGRSVGGGEVDAIRLAFRLPRGQVRHAAVPVHFLEAVECLGSSPCPCDQPEPAAVVPMKRETP